jgi:hypothetical protein
MNADDVRVEQVLSWGDVKFPNNLNLNHDPDFIYPEPSIEDMVFAVSFAIAHPDPRLSTAITSVLGKLNKDKLEECNSAFDNKCKRFAGFLLELFGNDNSEVFFSEDLFSEENDEFIFPTQIRRPHWVDLWKKQATSVHLKWGVLGNVDNPDWYARGKAEWVKSHQSTLTD